MHALSISQERVCAWQPFHKQEKRNYFFGYQLSDKKMGIYCLKRILSNLVFELKNFILCKQVYYTSRCFDIEIKLQYHIYFQIKIPSRVSVYLELSAIIFSMKIYPDWVSN